MRPLPILLLLLAPLSARAEVAALPDYLSFQLQARSHAGSNFNLPSGATLSDATPSINDSGRVAAKVSYPTGQPGDDFSRHVFVGSDGAGFVVSEGPTGSALSDPRVDPTGKVWFAANFAGGGGVAGIYRYDPGNQSTLLVTAAPAGTQSYVGATGNALAEVGYRADFAAGKAWVSFAGGNLSTHASSPGSLYSALFAPSFDDNQLIVGKVTLAASGFSQIRSIDKLGFATVLARSTAENAASPYLSFDNGVALAASSGRVAFIATLAGGARAVYRYDAPDSIVEIARTGSQGLSAIEAFDPAINDDGLVAFRGIDSNGKQAIFVGDDVTLRRVIGRGDPVPTNSGPAQIDQDTPGASVFSGGVAINIVGDVVFTAALAPLGAAQTEWGTGVYIARAGTQLIMADGFEEP